MPSIWEAAEQGDSNTILALIGLGYNINETGGAFNSTPLSVAVECEKNGCVTMLLDNNADVMPIDDEGATALFRLLEMWMCGSHPRGGSHEKESLLLAHRMLQMGASASLRASNGGTIMSMVIDIGVPALLRLVVRYGADPSAICYDYGDHESVHSPPCTALNYAIERCNQENCLEMVQLLIYLGADLSSPPGKMPTPLFAAIQWDPVGPQNQEDMVRLLLDNNVFLSTERADPDEVETPAVMYDRIYTPRATVEWLANYATRRHLPMISAMISDEPRNRARKSNWHQRQQNMRRDAFDIVQLQRLRDASLLACLDRDLIHEISRHI
jgi:hypothetical protein